MTELEVRPLTEDDVFAIGLAVTTMAAGMQLLGHANPTHTLMYNHGAVDEQAQFVEDFARLCKSGAKGDPEAEARFHAYANARGITRLVMTAAFQPFTEALTGDSAQ